jgi:hypothetical protein
MSTTAGRRTIPTRRAPWATPAVQQQAVQGATTDEQFKMIGGGTAIRLFGL